VSQTGVYPADWKPYTVYDLYGSYRATEELTLRLAMENVTDRAYLVPSAMSWPSPSAARTLQAPWNISSERFCPLMGKTAAGTGVLRQ